MKITVTGSLGNISKPLTRQLVKNGHQVTVISSDAAKQQAIEALGATAAIGSVNDLDFVTNAFTGADVVYTMVPPNVMSADQKGDMIKVGNTYAEAIKQAGVTKVVNLSSMGADLPEGTGPIAAIHTVEEILSALENVVVKHLRPAFFYVNYYGDLEMIKSGILGSNYGSDNRMLLVHPVDIADAAVEEIESPFTENSVRYVASDDRKAGDAAKVLGAAIGKPELPWVEFTDEQAFGAMVQAGLPENVAHNYTEMGAALRKGILFEDYNQANATVTGKIKLEDFAKEFARAYKQ